MTKKKVAPKLKADEARARVVELTAKLFNSEYLIHELKEQVKSSENARRNAVDILKYNTNKIDAVRQRVTELESGMRALEAEKDHLERRLATSMEMNVYLETMSPKKLIGRAISLILARIKNAFRR